MPEADTHGVQVHLTDEQHDWLRLQAYERHVPMSVVVREMIDAARESAKVAA